MGRDVDLYGYCLNDPVNFVDPVGLTVDPLLLYDPDAPTPRFKVEVGGTAYGQVFSTTWDPSSG